MQEENIEKVIDEVFEVSAKMTLIGKVKIFGNGTKVEDFLNVLKIQDKHLSASDVLPIGNYDFYGKNFQMEEDLHNHIKHLIQGNYFQKDTYNDKLILPLLKKVKKINIRDIPAAVFN